MLQSWQSILCSQKGGEQGCFMMAVQARKSLLLQSPAARMMLTRETQQEMLKLCVPKLQDTRWKSAHILLSIILLNYYFLLFLIHSAANSPFLQGHFQLNC